MLDYEEARMLTGCVTAISLLITALDRAGALPAQEVADILQRYIADNPETAGRIVLEAIATSVSEIPGEPVAPPNLRVIQGGAQPQATSEGAPAPPESS
jgi:hypothetical protein